MYNDPKVVSLWKTTQERAHNLELEIVVTSQEFQVYRPADAAPRHNHFFTTSLSELCAFLDGVKLDATPAEEVEPTDVF